MIKSSADKKKDVGYPKLMVNGINQIVLFTGYGIGTLLTEGKIIGYYSCRWDMDRFTLYTKPITLENT